MVKHEVHLLVPASRDELLVVRLTLSGLAMLAGLDVDLIGDWRVVSNECCDCLLHREGKTEQLEVCGGVDEGKLTVSFSAVGAGEEQPMSAEDADIVYGVLSTLLPHVELYADVHGVSRIVCSMPVSGDGSHE